MAETGPPLNFLDQATSLSFLHPNYANCVSKNKASGENTTLKNLIAALYIIFAPVSASAADFGWFPDSGVGWAGRAAASSQHVSMMLKYQSVRSTQRLFSHALIL